MFHREFQLYVPMSNLWQHQVKFQFKKNLFILCILFTGILLSSIVSSYQIGISPPETYFFGQTGEERCQNIMLFSSGKAVKAEIFTLWKRDLGSSKVIKDYTLSEEEKGVLLKYPKNVLVREQENITLCIKPLFEGDYEGVLILSPENGAMGVGSWIKFQSRMYNGEEKILSYPSLLHKSVRGEKSNTSFFLLFLIESTFIEGAAVVILSLFMRSRLHGSQ